MAFLYQIEQKQAVLMARVKTAPPAVLSPTRPLPSARQAATPTLVAPVPQPATQLKMAKASRQAARKREDKPKVARKREDKPKVAATTPAPSPGVTICVRIDLPLSAQIDALVLQRVAPTKRAAILAALHEYL